MQQSDLTGVFPENGHGNWMRLRTLILLRWMAIFGQCAAIVIADLWLGLQLPLWLCAFAIAASVLANLLSMALFPGNHRLTEREAVAMLAFDLAQLCLLIYATGGPTNPFALLILAPVTTSASVLGLRSTLLLGIFAVTLITLAMRYSIPIRLADGQIFAVPPLFAFGFWLAIVVGLAFLGVYARRIARETRAMSDALLATQMALAREQKLTDLGGVVAAAAHELGTPLATIKLVSSEMLDDLADKPDLLEDLRLIRDQADRCRDILRGMGRAGKDDLQLRQAPLDAVLREAAEPHLNRGKEVIFTLLPGPEADSRQPNILRRPEIIHGLRNLIQNAVDFATSTVWVDGEWSDRQLLVRIGDDGEGYSPQVIGRIGDPFVRSRPAEQAPSRRPEYEGMGLGLFIAKTLLERSGAALTFSNGTDPFLAADEGQERRGAVVELVWPLPVILAPADLTHAPNAKIEI